MYERVEEVTLRTGERVELGVVTGPDSSPLGLALRGLLGHKAGIWAWQIEQSLSVATPEMASRFYVLSRDGRPFANIMCAESRGVGIFGHVYTRPEDRRKGAADLLHAALMTDVRRRGARALFLGTDFDTPQYHLYRRHGFEGVEAGSDYMAWYRDGRERFEAEAFASSPVRREAFSFRHWPTLPALAMCHHPARVRIAGMDVVHVRSTEAGALPYLAAMAGQGVEKNQKNARAAVAVSTASGLPVAIAAVRPEPIFWDRVDLLDLFAAPGFDAELPPLIDMLRLAPDRRVVALADRRWAARLECLARSGFGRMATLQGYLTAPGGAEDAELWAKEGTAIALLS